MRRFVFGFVFLCCAFAYQARAMVPLEIKATLQLPSPANPWEVIPWDVQHCADDTSFGYAYVVGDTVYWVNRTGLPIHSFVIPTDSFPFGSGEAFQVLDHYKVRLLHLQSRDNHLCLIILSEVSDGEWGTECLYSVEKQQVFSIFDLDDNMLLGMRSIDGYSCERSETGNSGSITERIVENIVLWPPLPAASSLLVYSQLVNFTGWWPGDNSTYINSGGIFFSGLNEILFSISYCCRGNHLAPFANFNVNEIAYSGVYRHYRDVPYGYGNSESWSGTIDAFNPLSRDTLVGCSGGPFECTERIIIPQHDAIGTNRIISHGGYAVSATQFSDTLWYNPAITGDLYTARLTGCEDERILGFNTATRKFGIFSGSTGEYLDSTTAIEGNIAYLIKQPNRLDEIVTIDANRLVRIYGSAPSSPQNVVCYYSPVDSMIQLSWSPVFGASSYYIFSQPFCSESDEEWIGEVAGDTTCLVPISYTRECFRVSAVAQ